jgi:hypothetical protein
MNIQSTGTNLYDTIIIGGFNWYTIVDGYYVEKVFYDNYLK